MKGKSLIGVILAAICVTVTYLLPGSEEQKIRNCCLKA